MASYRTCRGIAAAALFFALPTYALAQGNQGTQEQRDACTPDAFRLCGAYMPDPDRVEACLRASGPRLSQPCYDVFFPQQQAAPPPPPPGARKRARPLLPPQEDED